MAAIFNRTKGQRTIRIFLQTRAQPGIRSRKFSRPAGYIRRESAMQDLPRNIDADVVIEIGRILDDAPEEAGISVSETIAERRRHASTNMTDEELETLIVRMSGPRGRAVIFDGEADRATAASPARKIRLRVFGGSVCDVACVFGLNRYCKIQDGCPVASYQNRAISRLASRSLRKIARQRALTLT
ncbi:hypothetical protein [Mesorhizobium sp.]|uniref:hypothetical protein n=1 Tax=Mesorhizobium sp. TaxID=1871066 RepID=UPI000FE4ED4C|nr:hypothetical protein [Mesorhizobium sp.]RWA72626.1 MAG: hypothetical protein EOQ29_07620 [Mesorhizobium sp.]RWE04223.1 MAG: hypothetical protein EOS40_00295 [Mesorhizobium sp.]